MSLSLDEQTVSHPEVLIEGHGWYVRPAYLKDAAEIAPHLRKADLEEVEAITGIRSGHAALAAAIDSSAIKFVGHTDRDGLVCAFGVANNTDPGMNGVGVIWCLGTDAITENPMPFLRASKLMLERMASHYEVLANYVHSANTVHIQWLRWLGFTFFGKVYFNGEEFMEFAKITPRGN